MNEEIDILLSRYFSGEASEKELRNLDIWLSESDENEKYFHQMTELYQLTGQTAVLPAIDTEKAWAKFKTYTHKNQKDKQGIFLKKPIIWRAAASLALLMVSAFALYYFTQTSNTVQLLAIETEKDYNLFENADVTLFSGTEIVYDKKNSHHIHLKGKATFTIHSHDEKKLVVQAGKTYIEDIGTIFTVDASAPDKSIIVEVTQGKIWFYTAENSGVYLNANQSAVYNTQSKQFQIIEPLISEELVFHNTPLHEAIDIIKTRYGVNIVISSKSIDNVLLNASFDNAKSVEYILEIIAETVDAELSKKDGGYFIGLE